MSELVGTRKDTAGLLDDLGAFAPAIGGLIPRCRPDAADAMWRFLTAVEEFRQVYQSGDGDTAVTADKVGLTFVRARGAELYKRLGLDGNGWQTVPATARLGCADLAKVATTMPILVLHLSNLVGVDSAANVNDATGYLVDIAGLTSALPDIVATCNPSARRAFDRFATAGDRVAAVFKTGTDTSAIAADKTALNNLRALGIALFTRLGQDTTGWKLVYTNAR